jgi:hypothetical protein
MNPLDDEEAPEESGRQSSLVEERPIDEIEDGRGVPSMVPSVVIP